jgi:N12 class adenine-specific DNA methylase/antirestriction protein ArdC
MAGNLITKNKDKNMSYINTRLEKNEEKLNAYYSTLADIFIKMYKDRQTIRKELLGKPIWENAPSLGGISNPFNGNSVKRYRGMNNAALVAQTVVNRYSDPRWLTFNQVKEAGGSVRQGEHGTPIIFVESTQEVPEVDENGNKIYDADGNIITKIIRVDPAIVRKYTVFNVEQCINFPPESKYAKPWNPKDMPPLDFDPSAQAEHWLEAIKSEKGLKILANSDAARYFYSSNMIEHPAPNFFSNQTEYYHVVFHEITHWTTETGARKINDLGFSLEEKKAYEEMVADLGSFLICRELNLADDIVIKRIMNYITAFAEKGLSVNTEEKFKVVISEALREAAKSYDYVRKIVRDYDIKHQHEDDRIYLNVDLENNEAVRDIVEKQAILDTTTQKYFITSSHNPSLFKGFIDNFDDVLEQYTLRQQNQQNSEQLSDSATQNVNNTSDEIQATQEKESNAPSVQDSNFDIYKPENFINFVSFASVMKFQEEVYKNLEAENQRLLEKGLSSTVEIKEFLPEETKNLHSSLTNLLLYQYQTGNSNATYDPSYWKKNIMPSTSALRDAGWSQILDNYIYKNYLKDEQLQFSNFSLPELTPNLVEPALNNITEALYETLDVTTGDFFNKELINNLLSDSEFSKYIKAYAEFFKYDIKIEQEQNQSLEASASNNSENQLSDEEQIVQESEIKPKTESVSPQEPKQINENNENSSSVRSFDPANNVDDYMRYSCLLAVTRFVDRMNQSASRFASSYASITSFSDEEIKLFTDKVIDIVEKSRWKQDPNVLVINRSDNAYDFRREGNILESVSDYIVRGYNNSKPNISEEAYETELMNSFHIASEGIFGSIRESLISSLRFTGRADQTTQPYIDEELVKLYNRLYHSDLESKLSNSNLQTESESVISETHSEENIQTNQQTETVSQNTSSEMSEQNEKSEQISSQPQNQNMTDIIAAMQRQMQEAMQAALKQQQEAFQKTLQDALTQQQATMQQQISEQNERMQDIIKQKDEIIKQQQDQINNIHTKAEEKSEVQIEIPSEEVKSEEAKHNVDFNSFLIRYESQINDVISSIIKSENYINAVNNSDKHSAKLELNTAVDKYMTVLISGGNLNQESANFHNAVYSSDELNTQFKEYVFSNTYDSIRNPSEEQDVVQHSDDENIQEVEPNPEQRESDSNITDDSNENTITEQQEAETESINNSEELEERTEDISDPLVEENELENENNQQKLESELSESTADAVAENETNSVVEENEKIFDKSNNFRINVSEDPVTASYLRINRNVEAIKILKVIENEKRSATPEEQAVLAQYTGWGGLASQITTKQNGRYTDSRIKEIKAILTEKEYKDAVESSLTAYYTSPKLISSIYSTLEKMNFKGGNVLEPSCGTGQFIGAIPDTLKDKVNFVGVELDSISARIAKQLYPHENIKECGFEKIKGKEKFDVVVGNVPFGDFSVYDPQYNKENFKIHNYFMSKSLAMVKPGGVIALITTHHTMDSQSSDHRVYMAQRGEFLGAVRLPATTFAPATNVVTDVIFLKKRDRILTQEEAQKEEWVNSKPIIIDEEPFNVNNFFINHPESVAGTFGITSTRFGLDITVRQNDNAPSVEEALNTIQGRIEVKSTTVQEISEADLTEDPSISDSIRKRKEEYAQSQSDGKKSKASTDPMVYLVEDTVQLTELDLLKSASTDFEVPVMSFVLLKDGSLRYHTKGSSYYKLDKAPQDMVDTLKAVIKVRDSAHKLLNMQSDGLPQDEIIKQQQNLNDEYGKFRRKYGTIGEYKKLFKDDASAQFLEQLEIREPIEKGGKYTPAERKAGGRFVGLADIFTKLTVRPPIQIEKVTSADEALRVSLAKHGNVNMSFISSLLGKDESQTKEIADELKGQIFLDMEQTVDNDNKPVYVTRSEYLSGHIQHKIDVAEKFGLSDQVDELKKVLPQWIEGKDISIQLASNWVPVKFLNEFIDDEILSDNYFSQGKIKVSYTHETGNFNLTVLDKSKNFDRDGCKAVTEYGTNRMNAIELIDCAFSHHTPIVYDKVDDHSVVNPKETAAAIDKLDKIQKRFRNWLLEDPERCAEVEKIYNERFNSIRAREYDGSYLTLPGSNPQIQLKPHQLNAVARITEGGNSLLAHEVGAGKTFEMIAGAMESKRLGKCSKSLLCVPNHIVKQFEEDFRKLYPNANIIVARKEDFSEKNRKAFLAKIAVSNCDAVIMGHTQFAKLPLSSENLNQFYSHEIALLIKAREAAILEGKKRAVSDLNARIKKLQARLDKLIKQDDKDQGITFEQTGIDKLFVDEAHSFKNLDTITSMSRVPGISSQGAGKSMDLLSKCQYLDSITNHKGVVFATGTPISNSMTELFTMMRYLQSDRLEQIGLSNFDSWVSNFGEISSELKLTPTGNKFNEKTSLASFKNVPELMNLFKEATDIKLAEDLKLNVPNAHFETISVEPSNFQKAIIKSLAKRAEAVHNHSVRPDEDNMLKITHDGRALGLDQRAYDPSAPDVPDSKTNVCIAKVLEIYKETEANKSTQLIFCDQCVPKEKNKKKTKTDRIDEITENDLTNKLDSSESAFDEDDIDTENKFNIYADIKSKLVKAGVPEDQIAFIHDAKNEDDKQKLFHKVQKGEVRILLGSTPKMGAGTNVQNKLIALHHLDIGWKPSDIEQRNGRIIRQGNENKDVKVFNYVTKGTFDAYLWQMQEAKQKFIKQIMTSKTCVRNCEDVDETELKYSEVKALAVGDGRIKEKMELEVELKKLQLREAAHRDEQKNLKRLVTTILPEELNRLTADKERLSQDIETLKQNPLSEVFQGITINGKFFGKRADAETEILKTVENFNTRDIDSKPLGSYRGFNLSLEHKPASICEHEQFYIKISGKNSYATSPLSVDSKLCRNIQRIDSRLSQVAQSLEKCQLDIESKQVQLKNCSNAIGKEFPEQEKMHEVELKLQTLSALLSKSDGDNDLAESVSETEELSNTEEPSSIDLSYDVDKTQNNDNSHTENQNYETDPQSQQIKQEHKHRIRR